jgi:hypothetical protein
VELFRAEKIATVNDDSNQDCRLCGGKLTLLKAMVEAESGVVNHLFECQRCGERALGRIKPLTAVRPPQLKAGVA